MKTTGKNKSKKKKVLQARDYQILSASVKDDLCTYSYIILAGVGEGHTHTVKGTSIVDNDLLVALRRLNVHMACIDDVFRHSGTEIQAIDKMHNHEFTALYDVSGFKIKGTEDNLTIQLTGTKSITCTGGRISIETPRVLMEELSGYPYYAELREAAEDLRNEVDEYHNGKCTPVEETDKENPKQMKIGDVDENSDDNFDDDLHKSKLK